MLRSRRRFKFLGLSLFIIVALVCHFAPKSLADDALTQVTVDWSKVSRILKTTLTLQVVVNPPLRPGSPIHDNAWKALHNLQADDVRYAFWFPYPRLGVAELEPPSDGHTSWDFSLMDPLMEDFFQATAGHPVVMTISTIPQWMFNTSKPVAYPANPDETAWDYEQGTKLRDSTFQEVAAYAARVVGWYTNGGFTDELGKRHTSSHHYKIDYWEVLNEPEYEHSIDPETYTRLYDAVVAAVHAVSPQMKFVGMSLAEPSKNPHYFEYFLDHKNHKPGATLDMISYHFYAVARPKEDPQAQQYTFFERADHFLDVVRYIESIRKRLSNETKTDINEVGCISADDLSQGQSGRTMKTIPNSYWNLCGATFAYLFAGLAHQGIDVLGASQLVGYPTQFPSVSLVDWNTGEPNARYRVLELLHENFKPGDDLVDIRSVSPDVFTQGFIGAGGKHKILLVNKVDRDSQVTIKGASGAREVHVDQVTAGSPAASTILDTDRVTLHGYSVMVVTLVQ